jgi:hypothetical protein
MSQKGANGGKGTIPVEFTDYSRVFLKHEVLNHLVPHFLSLLCHTHSKWAGLSYFSTKLVHSPQEINHYIKANIRTL